VRRIYRDDFRLLAELWVLIEMQDRQLPRLRLAGDASILRAAERLRNRTADLIQRLLAEKH
jgi:hypothetical protein